MTEFDVTAGAMSSFSVEESRFGKTADFRAEKKAMKFQNLNDN
jgi:hypothetical protein